MSIGMNIGNNLRNMGGFRLDPKRPSRGHGPSIEDILKGRERLAEMRGILKEGTYHRKDWSKDHGFIRVEQFEDEIIIVRGRSDRKDGKGVSCYTITDMNKIRYWMKIDSDDLTEVVEFFGDMRKPENERVYQPMRT